MAKKQTAKAAPTTEKTTTYSTRLNDEQRECLERAASIAGVSASRFMRDATLRAAADIENGAAPNDRAISHLTKRIADNLLSPKVQLSYEDDYQQTTINTHLCSGDWMSVAPVESVAPGELATLKAIRVDAIQGKDLQYLRQMAQLCPFTFARALITALHGATDPSPEFTGRTDPERILND